MGYLSEYLSNQSLSDFNKLTLERKKQLKEIQKLRGGNRDILVYASDLTKAAPVDINYDDKLSFYDQLPNSSNSSIDIIIETPGGYAEIVEDLVNNLRKKYKNIAVIIPGYAKSAGTIFAMASDEILMGDISALGPIDAQVSSSNGKTYSAGAFLKGFEDLVQQIKRDQVLDLAYIPILQNISPGEIEHCKNGQKFSQTLVSEWLEKYKFKNWEKRDSNDKIVTKEEKKFIASKIAEDLCDNSKWYTHGKSLGIEELRNLGLKITDFSKDIKLNEAIMKYYTLMRMSFEGAIYKIFETPDTQIYKMIPISNNVQNQEEIKNVLVDAKCPKCSEMHKIVLPFGEILKENSNCIPYPKTDFIFCKKCHEKIYLRQIREDVERQFGKKVVK